MSQQEQGRISPGAGDLLLSGADVSIPPPAPPRNLFERLSEVSYVSGAASQQIAAQRQEILGIQNLEDAQSVELQDEDIEILKTRADYIESRLEREAARLRASLFAGPKEERGESELLQGPAMLRSGKRWTYDAVRRMILNQPVDIELVAPVITYEALANVVLGEYDAASEFIPWADAARLFGTANPTPDSVQTVLCIDNQLYPWRKPHLSKLQRKLALKTLQDYGAIDPMHTTVLETKDLDYEISDAFALLGDKGEGRFFRGTSDLKRIAYEISPRTASMINLQWPGLGTKLRDEKIYLSHGANSDYNLNAFLASMALSPNRRQDSMRIGLSHSASRDRMEAFAMLLDADVVGFKDWPILHYGDTPEGAYRLCLDLLDDVRQYKKLLQRHASFMQMDQYAYSNKNYETLMTQDKRFIELEVGRARELICQVLDVDLDDPATLLDDDEILHVAVGSNLYPAILTHIYTRGRMTGIDVSPSAIQYNSDFQENGHDTQRWQEIAEYAGLVSNELRYSQALTVLRDPARWHVRKAGIHSIEKQCARLIDMAFGLEAFTESPQEFHEGAASIANGLADNGVFSGRFTLEYKEEGWDDGAGNRYHGLPLKADDVVLALMAAGLEVIMCEVIGDDVPAEERVRPDELMLYVLACRKEAVPPGVQTYGQIAARNQDEYN